MTVRISVRMWVAAFALAALAAAGARAQQQPAPTAPIGDVFESGGEPIYSDVFETSCKANNDQNNPWAGMNPLVCAGIVWPVDANGECTFHNLQVINKVGTACYYCEPRIPPTKGFIIPMDDLKAAEGQGFICGADQADPDCEAICQGNGTFNPPPGTTPEGGTPAPKPPTPTQPSPETKTPQSETPMPPPPPCNCTQAAASNTMGECIGQGVPQESSPQQSCQQDVTISTQGDEFNFVKGFVTGLGQCAWAACTNPVTITAIGVALFKKQWVPVINLLGLVGGAATLKNMVQGGEEGQPASADPYDVGLFVGKDFCKFEAAFFGVAGFGLRGAALNNSSAASQVGQCSMQMQQGLGGVLSGVSPAIRVCAAGSAEPPCNVSLPLGLQGVIESAIPVAKATCPTTTLANFRFLMQDTSWLKAMNSPGCGGNCGLCTAAVAQALLGKGILRVPNICPTSTSTTVLEKAFNSTFYVFDSIADINNEIYKAGDASQGIVWVGKADGSCGHFFYIVNDQNDVKLLDGQLGNEITWKVVQFWMQKSGWTQMTMMRTN